MHSNFSNSSLVTVISPDAVGDEGDGGGDLGVDETELLIPKAGIGARGDDEWRSDRARDTGLVVHGTRQTLRRSSSDHTPRTRTGYQDSFAHPARTAIRSSEQHEQSGVPPDASPAVLSLKPLRRQLERSTSSPDPRPRSRYHDPAIDSATLRQHLANQTKIGVKSALESKRVERVRPADGSSELSNAKAPQPDFKWFLVRTKSESDSTTCASSKARKTKAPLKSSMKCKSKSTAVTPTTGTTTTASTPIGIQPLRRVKTVDFVETVSKKLLTLPPLQPWSTDSNAVQSNVEDRKDERARKGKDRKKTPPIVPVQRYPLSAVKSKAADCAVTRTDVHVVAIAPNRDSDVAGEIGTNPATPTMQFVESGTGCYEVIWDDVPAEDDSRYERRNSSASQALHSVGSSRSTAARGLERVNSKLTEWTWGREFSPQIVVFPNEDSLNMRRRSATQDDHDAPTMAPPNSEWTSSNASRLPSQTASSSSSRPGSHDSGAHNIVIEACDSSDDLSGIEDNVPTLSMPDPEALTSTSTLAGLGRQLRHSAAVRKLSNIEDSDMKFRGHRDSVTLARSRIVHSGGVSPELFMHRDSVSMAKKRLHARNHAISEARDIERRKGEGVRMDSGMERGVEYLCDDGDPVEAKERAKRALRSSGSNSILSPGVGTGDKRHIRIVE